VLGGQVQTLPRNQTQSPGLAADYSHQTLPSRYNQAMQHSPNRTQMIGRGASGNHLSQQNINQQILQQKVAQQQLAKQQLISKSQQQIGDPNQGHAQISAQLYHNQQLMQQQYQQAAMQQQQQQAAMQQQQQQAAMQQQQQQQAAIQQKAALKQQQQSAIKAQQQQAALKQQQEKQAVEKLLERQRAHEAEQRQRQVEEKMAALTVNNQEGDRTYMNVQPVAVAGRGGRILSPEEIQDNLNKQGSGGKKVPAIPKSQEVKHLKEALYSTPLQFPGAESSKSGGMFDEGVYANYAPASLYSNYSNYSELEVLRSTGSQCDEEEPTEGLPNLGDSPVSSSYSELRQANVQPNVPVTHNSDGSIYEPVLPPKGIPGPNSIHFKTLSSGSTDSDYFGSCVQCGAKIIGEGAGCSAMGRLYHIQCFTCTECGRLLQGLPFYPVEGLPLCEADYTNTLEKCCKCCQPILERILRATGKPYHPTCFTCVACNKSLDGIPFTVDATNQIHCIEDFHRRFAPRCSVCQDPIMPTPGQEETVRVVALDRSFHIQCYRCVDCNLVLSSEEEGRGCYPLDNTVLCRGCNTRRIQTLTSTIASE